MISVIICSADDANFRVVSNSYAAAFGEDPYELIRIPDAKSIAAAYNAAVDRARGEIVVFSHDDIEILTPDLGSVLRRALARFDVIGVAGTSKLVGPSWILAYHPHIFGQIVHVAPPPEATLVLQVFNVPSREIDGIEALDGVFIATRREVLNIRRFDEQLFDGFHLYDVDFTFRCARSGMKVGVACDIHLVHRSDAHSGETWNLYAQRFQQKFSDVYLSAPVRQYQCTLVPTQGKSELPALMTPPYWQQQEIHCGGHPRSADASH